MKPLLKRMISAHPQWSVYGLAVRLATDLAMLLTGRTVRLD